MLAKPYDYMTENQAAMTYHSIRTRTHRSSVFLWGKPLVKRWLTPGFAAPLWNTAVNSGVVKICITAVLTAVLPLLYKKKV